jgi:hypothetical protein
MVPEDSLARSEEPTTCPFQSQKNPVHTLNHISLRRILILFFHLRVRYFEKYFIFRLYNQNIVRISQLSHACYMPSSHSPWFYHPNTTLWEYKLWSSSLGNFPYNLVNSSLLCRKIQLGTLFPNTLILCSYLNVRDQISGPNKTKGKIKVILYSILISNAVWFNYWLNNPFFFCFPEINYTEIIKLLIYYDNLFPLTNTVTCLSIYLEKWSLTFLIPLK